MINTYATRVSLVDHEGETYIGIDMPPELLQDMDLQANEILDWSIDTDTKTVTITKKNVILTQE